MRVKSRLKKFKPTWHAIVYYYTSFCIQCVLYSSSSACVPLSLLLGRKTQRNYDWRTKRKTAANTCSATCLNWDASNRWIVSFERAYVCCLYQTSTLIATWSNPSETDDAAIDKPKNYPTTGCCYQFHPFIKYVYYTCSATYVFVGAYVRITYHCIYNIHKHVHIHCTHTTGVICIYLW